MRHLSNNLRGTVFPLLLLRVERRASSSLPLHCCSFRIFPFFFPSVSVDSIPLAHLEFAKKKAGIGQISTSVRSGIASATRFGTISNHRVASHANENGTIDPKHSGFARLSNRFQLFFFLPREREREKGETLWKYPQCVASEFVQSVLFARTERRKTQEGGRRSVVEERKLARFRAWKGF